MVVILDQLVIFPALISQKLATEIRFINRTICPFEAQTGWDSSEPDIKLLRIHLANLFRKES